jgi:8-oxo-dGTP pyrophosphatase MutT (NUDIX family)
MNVRHDMVYCIVARPDKDEGTWEFLQLRRRHDDFMGGTWQPVSGRIEPGEIGWKAALRELHEETGLTPKEFFVIEFINAFYIASEDTMWNCTNFLAVVEGDANVILSDEHDAFRWISEKDIDANFMWPGDRRAIEEAIREILHNGPAKEYLRINLANS